MVAAWKSAVTGESEDNAGSRNGAALANKELAHDIESEHGEASIAAKDLHAQGAEGLSLAQYVCDVRHRIYNDQYDGPPQVEAQLCRHYDSAWRSDVCVAALLG